MGNVGLLVRCYEGLHNWRALLLLSGGVLGGLLLMAAAGMMAEKASFLIGSLVGLIALAMYMAGINGAGLLLVDQADGRPRRGMVAAFFGGLHATLTAFLALLLLALGLPVVVVLLYVLSLLGRIPGIGPMFAFLFAGPRAVVLGYCYGLLAIGVPLLLVAVWRGEGVLGSIGRTVDIVLKRPLDALLHFVLLALIVTPVAFFVIVLMSLISGASIMMYASGSSFGGGMPYGGYSDGFLSMAMNSMADRIHQMGAASASVGIVMTVLVALFVLVGMFGYIMVYDSLGAGVASSAEDRLRGGFGQLKQKIEQHRPKASARTRTGTSHTCAACGAGLMAGDQFCGECGQRT